MLAAENKYKGRQYNTNGFKTTTDKYQRKELTMFAFLEEHLFVFSFAYTVQIENVLLVCQSFRYVLRYLAIHETNLYILTGRTGNWK